MKKRIGKISSLTDKEMIILTQDAVSITDILRKLNLSISGGSHRLLVERLKNMGLHDKMAKKGRIFASTHASSCTRKPIQYYLTNGSVISSSVLKKYILKEQLLENQCAICGQEPVWNGKELVLHLDHINGNHQDNRLENLRIVCPNCHTQTETYCGKLNEKERQISKELRKKKKQVPCIICGAPASPNSKYAKCYKCFLKLHSNRKVERPPLNVLLKEIRELGYSGVGRKYGVSGNAIKKWVVSSVG